jgi:hypothetical protein
MESADLLISVTTDAVRGGMIAALAIPCLAVGLVAVGTYWSMRGAWRA